MISFLRALASFLAVTFSRIFVAFSWIKIEAQGPDRLVLNANSRPIVADKSSRLISAYGRPIARFEAMDAIEVQHFTNGKRFEWWVVSLNLVGQHKIRIGSAVDDVQASIAAAAFSTITGKRVRALQGWGL